MNRHVLTLELRDAPGVVASYREYHAQVWPEVAASLTNAGVRRLDIYLLDRRLVMILDLEEGLDLARVFERHASSGAKVTEWEQLMKSLQQRAPGAREGEWWASMEQVFELTACTGASAPPANPAGHLLRPEC
jgi:L-rhamnose mutarotase